MGIVRIAMEVVPTTVLSVKETKYFITHNAYLSVLELLLHKPINAKVCYASIMVECPTRA